MSYFAFAQNMELKATLQTDSCIVQLSKELKGKALIHNAKTLMKGKGAQS